MNRGTFRRGYNQMITCVCCGHKTQSQIGSGTELCQKCYDFGGECNAILDGEPIEKLPKPTHDCKRCQEEYEYLQKRFAKTKDLTTGQQCASVPNSMTPDDKILIGATRNKLGKNHYRYTATFNDGSKESLVSRQFAQYALVTPGEFVYYSTTKPTGPASSYVAITEAKPNNMAKKANKASAKKPAAKKAAKTGTTTKRIDTGYVAAIRALLRKGKFTLSQAAEKIKEQYPDKDVQSIKRIASNVAKRMRKDPETKDIRWVPGAPPNTGYMARIDELLRGGKHTTRQIGETVAKEFDKDPVSAKKVVRARLKRLRDGGDKTVKPLLESDIREKAPKKTTKASPKAQKGKAKVKTAAKAPKGKKGARKQAAAPAPSPVTVDPAATASTTPPPDVAGATTVPAAA